MGCLRGNSEEELKKASTNKASAFARQVLGKVGGSSVYISPKENKDLIDMS